MDVRQVEIAERGDRDVELHRIDATIPKGQQSFPLVVNGVIYVTTSNDHVFAVDGGSGKVLWHYRPSDTGIFQNFGVTANRGVAYCDGKVYLRDEKYLYCLQIAE